MATETTEAKSSPEASEQKTAEVQDAGLKPVRRRKKWPLVTAIIVAVFAVTIVGGFVWHNQPSFCSAICHNPMDTYVNTYYSGNESLGVTVHANADKACLDCHEPTVSQQLDEAMTWMSGKFKVSKDGYLASSMTYDLSFCMNESCHDMDRVALAETSKSWTWDVHSQTTPHGETPCAACHSMHKENQLYCATGGCHAEAVEFAGEIGWRY
jgi:hypothetical protein